MALTVDYLTTLADAADLTTYNFSGATVSVPADGLLVAIPSARQSSDTDRSPPTMSLGGSAATVWGSTTGSGNQAAIAGRVVAAGSHTVSVTWTGGVNRCACHLYLVRGYASTTPYDIDSFATNGVGTTATITLDYPTGGGVGIYGGVSATSNPIAWSNASEDYDALTEVRFASARRTDSGAGVSETITTSTNGRCLIGAAWEPAPSGGNGLLLSNAAYFAGQN